MSSATTRQNNPAFQFRIAPPSARQARPWLLRARRDRSAHPLRRDHRDGGLGADADVDHESVLLGRPMPARVDNDVVDARRGKQIEPGAVEMGQLKAAVLK